MSRNTHFTTRRGGFAAAFFLLLLAGCAVTPQPRVPADLLRADLDAQRRLAILHQLGHVGGSADPAGYRDALVKLIVSDAQPDALRIAAIDRLATDDEPLLRDTLARRLAVIDRWAVIGHACDTAVGRGWADFVPALVASYARPSSHVGDLDRPERRAIASLRPDISLERAVFDVFDAPRDGVTDSQRVAAWVLLSRLDDPRRWLAEAASDALLVETLRGASVVLTELPRTPQACALLQLGVLVAPGRWNDRRDGLPVPPPVALRHLLLLDWLAEGSAVPLSVRLQHRRHVARRERLERDPAWTEDYARQRDRLAPLDGALLHALLDAMDDRAVVAQWFAQADADHADTSSEHGGALVRHADGSFEAVAFAPDTAAHDRQYVASPELLLRLAGGGVHYHFHAQSHRNAGFAGPGPGDVGFVERYEVAALVLTFIDRDTLNIDYYHYAPGGPVVIDLGCITR